MTTTAPEPVTAPTPAPSLTSYHDGRVAVWGGDCLALMASLPPDSVDAIVTDPPYGLGFMGKKWDDLPPGKEWAEACYRVLKPGGHLLAFGGTRTWHRLAVAIEDGGFEIRDSLAWLYGSGFPKSMNVGKAIDKAAGFERTEKAGVKAGHEDFVGRDNMKALRESGALSGDGGFARPWMHDPEAVERAHWDYKASSDAEPWEGWGTALKPAFEPIVVARKPLAKGSTVAANVLAHGTGALNIDGCRVGTDPIEIHRRTANLTAASSMANASTGSTGTGEFREGRWPANVVLDESQAEALDEQSGVLKSGANPAVRGGDTDKREVYGGFTGGRNEQPRRGTDVGGASRFFYCAKAPKSERPVLVLEDGTKLAHPTVKPVTLMRWLVRLVTPPGGLVLDTFAGTGTTGEACVLEGFRCLLAEDPTKGEQDYLPLIGQRITRAIQKADAGLPVEKQEQTA